MICMSAKLILMFAVVAAGCRKDEPAPHAGSGTASAKPASEAGSGTASVKTGSATPSATTGSAAGRPASITDEMMQTFELYVAAFEKLTRDLAAAGTDCKKAVAVAQRNPAELAPIAKRGEQLRNQMFDGKDPAAGAWLGGTYAPRFKAAIAQMGPVVAACTDDPALKQAMNSAMDQYPMMRKKQP